jgi:hypothetical protein
MTATSTDPCYLIQRAHLFELAPVLERPFSARLDGREEGVVAAEAAEHVSQNVDAALHDSTHNQAPLRQYQEVRPPWRHGQGGGGATACQN